MSLPTMLVDVTTAIMIFFLVVNSFNAVLICCAVAELWSHWQLVEDDYFRALLGAEALAPVSVVVTARNRREEMLRTAHALLKLDYPRYEVVLVDDGSSDETIEALVRTFDMARVSPAFMVSIATQPIRAYYRSRTHPRLLVIDKVHGGTADGMNAGMNAARYPYTMIVASSIVFERDALLKLMRPFLLNRAVYAVSGWMRVTDGTTDAEGRPVAVVPHGIRAGARMIEYLRTFAYERLGWNRVASNLVFPDMAVVFKREHLVGVGGFDPTLETPGTDIMVRLQRYLSDGGVNGLFLTLPDLVAWIKSPDEMVLQPRGRAKRQRGLLRALWRERTLLWNPEHGAFGMLALPYYWLAWIIAPFLELAGYVVVILGGVTGVLSSGFVWAYLAATLAYGMLLSVWTVALEAWTIRRYARRSDFVRLLLYALAEPFGPRQLVAWYRVRAFFTDRSLRHSHGQLAPTRFT